MNWFVATDLTWPRLESAEPRASKHRNGCRGARYSLFQPSCRRRCQSSFGLKIPTGVMMPVIKLGGVTSKPGFRAPLVGLATRTYWIFDF